MTFISKSRLIELAGYALALSSLLLTACGEAKETNLDKLCGNWVSVGRKPDVLVFKEGEQYKITVFKKSGVSRKLKPETFLIVEESGNLFINTGYRIDIAYNEETDVLTFSPNGDYTRAGKRPTLPAGHAWRGITWRFRGRGAEACKLLFRCGAIDLYEEREPLGVRCGVPEQTI